MLKSRYAGGESFEEHVQGAPNRELWLKFVGRVLLPEELVARAASVPGRWHLLVISEDWCGDAVNTLPPIVALAERAPNLDLRVLPRDRNLDLMEGHLTGGALAIPIVIVLDEQYQERGWWGPRPAELQAWVVAEGKALSKEDRYRQIRTWYARDRGRTTLEEIIAILERAAGEREAA